MTDHYTESLDLLGQVKLIEESPNGVKIALAQVHASLAVAEQLRIANLLTYYQAEDLPPLELRSDVARALRIENTDA